MIFVICFSSKQTQQIQMKGYFPKSIPRQGAAAGNGMDSTPGPGNYEIAGNILKPIYETFKKRNNVIVVKINHFGGTPEFKSQAHRFDSTEDDLPGPGSYSIPNINKKHHQKYYPSYKSGKNYQTIQTIIKNNGSIMPSIPNYQIEEKQQQRHQQYNGMPLKLQQLTKQASNRASINTRMNMSTMIPHTNRTKQNTTKITTIPTTNHNTINNNNNSKTSLSENVKEYIGNKNSKMIALLSSQQPKGWNNLSSEYGYYQNLPPLPHRMNMLMDPTHKNKRRYQTIQPRDYSQRQSWKDTSQQYHRNMINVLFEKL